jgi:DNA polymerase-1
MAMDYAQLEMRILAHMSKDATLCGAICDGLDVHTSTAATMFRVSYDDIVRAREKAEQGEELSPWENRLASHRKAAKAINFGLMYGQGANKLAITLGCDVDEARKLIRQYFSSFPRITSYFKGAISVSKELGYCTTIMGRRRLVPGFRSLAKGDVAEAERKVKNSPIQGTAAEIAKMAMIKIYEDDYLTNCGLKMLIQVHDEIVFDVPSVYREDQKFNNRLTELMAHPFDFDLAVPLETSSKYGDNWLECK